MCWGKRICDAIRSAQCRKQVPVDDFCGGKKSKSYHGNDSGVQGTKPCLGKYVPSTRLVQHWK